MIRTFTILLPLLFSLSSGYGQVVASTDFTNRTVAGKVASNLTWTLDGVADPGDLTWTPTTPQNSSSSTAVLFDTNDAAHHFAPQRNIDNQGAWSVSIPLTPTVPEIEINEVALGWRHFNNSGNFQTAERSADWTATVVGSASGLVASTTATGVSGLSGNAVLRFSSTLLLDDSQTYTLTIHVVGTNFPAVGNNTALNRISIGKTEPDTRPSILFLMADDQRFDTLGCYGHPVVKTPVIDSLAERGVRFANAFVTTPICAASRASVLTGVTERTHGYTFGQPSVPAQLDALSYPKLLRQAGYRTGFIGKYGVSLATSAANHFDSVQQVAGYATSTPYFIQQPDGTYRHSTDICADKAIEFIEEQSSGQPFCLSISFNAPHARDGATVAAESYPWPSSADGLYLTEELPDQGLNETWFANQPAFVRDSISRNRFNWRWNTPEKYDSHMRAHLRMITGIDTAIGNILTTLENEGLADNTIVVYTADNGLFLGARGFAGKWNHYEQSLRVPLVICDPRLPENRQGRVEPAIALNIDFAPTFLEWAEQAPSDHCQGVSLAPIVEGRSAITRADFFCEHHMDNASIPKWRGVRDQRYVYADYYEEGYEYLHDIQADPGQWVNLALDVNYQEVLQQMRNRSATYQAVLQTRASVANNEVQVLDSEPDGLLDFWELNTFGNLTQNSHDDPDGDGFDNRSESLAGTAPNDATSRPNFTIHPNLQLTYAPYAPGRTLELQQSVNLASDGWTTLSFPANYDGTTVTFAPSGKNEPAQFFRIQISDSLAP
ncbi:sulfatase [Roseibacillus persicicus]|uniref:sulfatase family protein n=1 Tax=Roseibacillus persicicus TaxID=454148 RepID=UPI00398A8DA9